MADATVTVGDTVTVDYSVLNRGDITDTQDIILKADGTEKDRDSGQMLTDNETVRGTLIWDTSGESSGTYSLEVISDDDVESRSVELTSKTQIVDDFEDGNISEYGGDSGSFAATTEGNVTVAAQNGSAVLEGTNANGSPVGISSTSGLSNYPSQGDTFRVWMYLPSGTGVVSRVYYGTQSETSVPDGYQVDLNTGSSELRLVKVDGGGSVLATSSQSWTVDEWYEAEVGWATDDDHTVKIFNSSGTQVASVSATDGAFTSGGVGFQVNTSSGGVTGFYDHYRIL